MIERLRRWCSAWALWQAPRRVVVFVLTVNVVAVVSSTVTGLVFSIDGNDLVPFALLALCAWLAIEFTRHIERKREHARSNSVAYIDTNTVWSFAAVIILPPALASTIVVFTHVLSWSRIKPHARQHIVHRWIFSCATVLCGTQVAVWVLASGMSSYPGAPAASSLAGLADLGIVIAAGLLRWGMNAGLVMAAIALTDPSLRVGELFANYSEYFLEAGAAGLGLVAAVVVAANPFVLPGIVIAMVALHRSILVNQYRLASRTDAKTGLASVGRWHEFAQQALARAGERSAPMGLLILDLDHFKSINDTYGHPFGDEVLRAVANELRGEIRDDDACGRWGGEEFAVVLPDVGTRKDLYHIGERIRRRVESIVIEPPEGAGLTDVVNITVSVGGAIYSKGSSSSLDDLLLAADSALYEAKNAGRNTVRLSPTAMGEAVEPMSVREMPQHVREPGTSVD